MFLPRRVGSLFAGAREDCVLTGRLTICFPDDLMAGVVPGRVVLERSGDHSQLLMAKGWIAECVERHAECRRVVSSSPEPELPTRVIEIGAGTLRLLQTNGQRGKWAALSHRWGTMSWKDKVFNRKSPIMTLLSTNNERLQQSIDPEHLTKTFQDAITVTHTLGLRYLWIDSLCIIQDSIEDWERESNLMADVYSHAQVTISAAAGPKGIFCEREWAKSSNPVKYQIFTGAGVGTIMFDIEHVNKRTPDPDLNYLQSRAWCFQEARLSPRLLAFDQAQMSLTCLQGRREEAIETSGRDGRKKRNDFMLEYGDAEHPRKSKQDILEMWYNLVEDYSARNLTVASDKLVAISSVAKVINTHLGDDYMAGMWKNSPPQGLLWRPDKRDDTFNERAFPSTTLRPYRAPSWSWASVEGRVAFFFARNALEETTIASIVNLHCDNDGKDKYGPCRNGHLEIRGPLKPAFTGERNLWIASHIGLYRPNTTGKGDTKEEFAFCMLDAIPGLKQGSDIWCFQISTGHGLVLQKKSNSPEEYMRIGIFTQDTERRATPENLCWWAEGGHSTIKVV